MTSFFQKFIELCSKTDLKKSDEEEENRYDGSPYYERIGDHLRSWLQWTKRPKENE